MTNFQVSCQIQEIPENGADVAHLAAIHKDLALLGGEPNGWITKATGLISWHDWTVSWKGRTLYIAFFFTQSQALIGILSHRGRVKNLFRLHSDVDLFSALAKLISL